MRVPQLALSRRHNLATLTVSFGRVWHRREVDGVVLGYNAVGRLAKLVILDAEAVLASRSDVRGALEAVIGHLDGRIRAQDEAVLHSALERAPAPERT